MRRLFVMYYQLKSIINLSTTNLKLITLSSYMSVILRFCKARLLPSAAKQNSILNRQRFNEEAFTHIVSDMFYRPN